MAGCSSSGSCKSACKKIAQCLGIGDASTPTSDGASKSDGGDGTTKDAGTKKDSTGWTCSLSEKCTTTEACYAKCINKASCDAITGKDADGSSALAKCQADCDKVGGDAALFDAGPLDDKPSDQKTDQKDACVPDCTDRECGSNGCGGSCGSCYSPEVCNTSSGQCVTSCTPDCSSKQCGDNGCSGSCGSCGSGYFCNSYYQCEKTCTSSCSGKQCGDDGCGGSCGTCTSGYSCDTYTYQCKSNCTPSCSGKQCGDDGCGGSCGTCPSPATCSSTGICQPPGQCTTVDYTFSSSSLSPLIETHTDSTVKWQASSYRYHSSSYALYYGNPLTQTFAGAGTNSGVAILPSITVSSTGTTLRCDAMSWLGPPVKGGVPVSIWYSIAPRA